MKWQVARSKTWALLSLGLKLKSKPSRVLVGSKAARRSRRRSLLWARRSTSSCRRLREELDVGGLLLDGPPIADLERLEDARQAQRAEHGRELMAQSHWDLSSSAPGSG